MLGWAINISSLDKLLLSGDNGPESSFWRSDQSVREAESYEPWSLKKLDWALAMLFNMRGIRWNYQVKNIAPSKSAKKSRLLLWHCVEFFYCLVGDAVSQLWYHLFMGRTDLDLKHMTLRDQDPVWSFIGTITFGLLPAYMIQLQYVLFAITWVGMGWSKPEDWPLYFHHISEATTVRKF